MVEPKDKLVFTWGNPGDGFVYDGWDEALTNLHRHLLAKNCPELMVVK